MEKVYGSAINRLIRSSEVKQAAVYHAGRVLAVAQADPPVDTGAYRSSLHVEETEKGAAVVAGVDYAKYVEADQGVLARALNKTPKE